MRPISLCFILIVLSSSFSYAEPLIPQKYVEPGGRVCVKKYADDGCNTCLLVWIPKPDVSDNWVYSCTQVGCLRDTPGRREPGQECLQYLGLSSFEIPLLDGKTLTNCARALWPDRLCRLIFDQNTGFQWTCRSGPKHIQTDFEAPLCLENYAGETINAEKQSRLIQAEQKRLDDERKAKRNQEKMCIRYETPCNYVIPMIFPPQTNQTLAYGSYRSPKFDAEAMNACRREHRLSKPDRTCIREITRGELPEINYDGDRYWLDRNKGIQLQDRCVRYENECFAYHIVLGGIDGDLTWLWYPKQKNCPMEVFKKRGNQAPMTCTSFYAPE